MFNIFIKYRLLVILLLVSMLIRTPSVYAVSTDTCFDTDTYYMGHMDDTGLTDSSTTNTTTTESNFARSSTQSQFGGFSGNWTTTTGYQSLADSDGANFGTGDFTIDFWYRHGDNDNQLIMSDGGQNDWLSCYAQDAGVRCQIEGSSTLNANTTLTNGNWYHIALVRTSGTFKIFVGGTSLYSATQSATVDNGTNPIIIGRSPTNPFIGVRTAAYIDEVRIVKGVAVWTANFTPPTGAYTACAGPFKPKAILI